MRPLSRLAALAVLLLNACYPAGDGKAPPLEELYFPTGLALDEPFPIDGSGRADSPAPEVPKFLYVVNSDFDLQYRSASVISYDLNRLSEVIPKNCRSSADCAAPQICDAPDDAQLPPGVDPNRNASYYCVDPVVVDGKLPVCGDVPERDEADLVIYPGRCPSLDPEAPGGAAPGLLVDKVGIGAFATDALWRANQEDPDASRLFIPVRGDSTLHWIDVHDGKFSCGQNGGEDDACDAHHRSGDSSDATPDHLKQPAEPYGIDATANGKYVAVTNQTTGSVSLFHNEWPSTGGPKLVSIASGLPFAPVGIAALPAPVFADDSIETAPGFLVTYRSAAQIDLLRVSVAEGEDNVIGTVPYDRYTLTRAGSVPINANSLGFDSRGIAIDDTQRRKDYDSCRAQFACSSASDPVSCAAQLTECLQSAHQPSVFVASRAPASLLVGAMTADTNYLSGTNELPSFTDSVSLTFGPSRAIAGYVRVPGSTYSDSHGAYDLERRVFVVCFDSRRIFVYDPKRRLIEAIVSTGRGPYALAVDGQRGLAYVGHFTDSYLGVISLDQRFPKTYATIVASIGTPKAPRSSK